MLKDTGESSAAANSCLKDKGFDFGNLSQRFGSLHPRYANEASRKSQHYLDLLLASNVHEITRMSVASCVEPTAGSLSQPAHKTGWRQWLAPGVISALIIAIYASPFAALVRDWWTDNQGASYGVLIPPLALYIAYVRRVKTFAVPAQRDSRGLAIIFASCLMLLVGKMGAEFFLTRLSLILLLTGLSVTFWGWARTRTLRFPLLLLVTMLPLPLLVYSRLTLPLQLFSSNAATSIIQFFGGSVYQDGNILHLPNSTLGVEEACSGLHSLASLVVAALLLGFTECRRLPARIALVILSVPFAIAINVARVTGTALLASVNQDYAEGFYHAFSGWLVFLVGFAFTWLTAKAIHRLFDSSSSKPIGAGA